MAFRDDYQSVTIVLEVTAPRVTEAGDPVTPDEVGEALFEWMVNEECPVFSVDSWRVTR